MSNDDRLVELFEIMIDKHDKLTDEVSLFRKEMIERQDKLSEEVSLFRKEMDESSLHLLQEQQITNVRLESLEGQMKGVKEEIREVKTELKEVNVRLGHVESHLSTVTKVSTINQDAQDRFEERLSKLEEKIHRKSA